MRAVLRQAPLFWVVLGQGFASASSFATVLALARWGHGAALGDYALGLSCWFLAMALGDAIVATPYTYLLAQKQQPTRDLPMIAMWATCAISTAFALLLTLLWRLDLAAFSESWPALPAAIAALSMREFLRRHLLARGRSAQVLRVDFFGALIQVVGVLMLAASSRLSAQGAFSVIALAASLCVLAFWRPGHPQRAVTALAEAACGMLAMFRYGRWLLIGGMCHVASVQAFPWLAFVYGGQRLAGLFAACIALANLLVPVLTGLTNYYRPRFMSAFGKDSSRTFASYVIRHIGIFVAPALMMLAALVFMGGPLLALIYGQNFVEGESALVLLGVGGVAVALAAPLQLAMLASGFPVANLYYHGSNLLWLLLLVALGSDSPSLADLARMYAAANWGGSAVIVFLFLAFSRHIQPHQL